MFNAYFEEPYYGKDHNDYVNGAGFCCAGNDKKHQAYGGGIGKGNEEYEKKQYYDHADHLGSSSYITNLGAQIVQHVAYVPFGEVFIEERDQSWNTPYLFNGKELDEEMGLYYYGARYYNPRESVWLSTDPLSGYNPIMETEHYIDGQHNKGVFNSFNLNTYGYCYQNPVVLIDPNGRQIEAPNLIGIVAHAAFARYMNTISGISGNWKPESPLFRDFRPDLLYYGGNTNDSGMGAVWELKPFTQSLDTKYSMSSVLQINHYVDELNARGEGGLTWATGMTALGTPKPFEGTLTLMCDKYQFLYYITYPEQGFIYYSYEQLKQPEPEKVSQSVPQLPPVVVPAAPQTKPTSSPSGRGVPALLDKILRFPIFIISSPIIEFYNNSNNIDPRIT